MRKKEPEATSRGFDGVRGSAVGGNDGIEILQWIPKTLLVLVLFILFLPPVGRKDRRRW